MEEPRAKRGTVVPADRLADWVACVERGLPCMKVLRKTTKEMMTNNCCFSG
jgi:hypothetical protein